MAVNRLDIQEITVADVVDVITALEMLRRALPPNLVSQVLNPHLHAAMLRNATLVDVDPVPGRPELVRSSVRPFRVVPNPPATSQGEPR
ncbi:hypothetical protein ACFCV3_41695 [Kribbella sp. NPDC056345]|uniref:hypothetical protein n=1 Tax=Kribbella sp. NPDC056345 TaxID=3345789 RepID=UPI0035DE31CC